MRPGNLIRTRHLLPGRSAGRTAAATHLVACCAAMAAACGDAPMTATSYATAVAEATAREHDLWPGFEPDRYPLAIVVGDSTFLIRHPTPPAGFNRLPGRAGLFAMAGSASEVIANTAVDLGGTLTAVMSVQRDSVPVTAASALALHELFHVHQRTHHPRWTANEVSLFTYPVDDADALALRRLETTALRRALDADADGALRCWAAEAIRLRGERFARLPAEAADYERGTELSEGLARYVEWKGARRKPGSSLVRSVYPPADVRERAYDSGAGIAFLLDRLDRDWRARLDADSSGTLDGLLQRVAVSARASAPPDCGVTADETAHARRAAHQDIADLLRARERRAQEFVAADGWRIEMGGGLLFPEAFDPLNVEVLGHGRVLHSRYLVLSGQGARLEVNGPLSLTEAAGPHPLFNGVRSVTITGLDEEPALRRDGSTVHLSVPGVDLRANGATVVRDDRSVRIQL